MNLVLIGYRGTGKSTVAKFLATNLAMEHIGMDAEIVNRAGMPIPEFVEQNGWPAFRDLETEVARDFAARENVIIDCGGGVIERPENIDMLKANGTIFWLKASIPLIVSRIQGDNQRPSLTGEKSFTDEVEEVLSVRTPKYAAAAHREIDIDDSTSELVAQKIAQIWQDEIATNP